MPIHRVTCPECRTVLKSRRRIPRGKLLTCPKCEVMFAAPASAPVLEVVDEVEVVEDDDVVADVEVVEDAEVLDDPPPKRPKAKQPEEVQSIAGKPFPPAFPDAVPSKPKVPPKRPKSKSPEDEPQSIAGRPLPPPLADGFLATPKAKAATKDPGFEAVEEEDEAAGDDRPKRKKSKRREPLTMRQIVGLTAGGIMLILVTIFTAWFFLHGSSVESDPLAYVPPDPHVIAGVKLGAILKAAPSLDQKVREAIAASPFGSMKAETGLEFGQLFDEAYAGFRFGPMGNTQTIVGKSAQSFSKEKLARSFQGSTPAVLDGYRYYKINQAGLNAAYLPTSRLIVLAQAPDPILDAVFAGEAKKGSSSPEANGLIQKISGNHFWAVCALQRMDAQARQPVFTAVVNALPAPPDGIDPKNLADQCRAMAFWGSVNGGQIDFHYGLLFDDEGKARDAVTAMEAGAKKSAGGVASLLMAGMPSVKALYDEMQKSLKVSTSGLMAEESVQISLATLEAVFTDAPKIAAVAGNAAASGQPLPPPGEKSKEPPPPTSRRRSRGEKGEK
jgi:hypothetical protein